MTDSRACITGLGFLGPLGSSVDDLRRSMMDPAAAFGVCDLPDVCEPPRRAVLGLAGEFKDQAAAYLPPALRRRMSRHSRMACVAAGQALRQAGLLPDNAPAGGPAADCGVVYGTALGSTGQCGAFFDDFLDKGPRLVNPALFLETVPNAPAGQIAILYGLEGPNATICRQNISAEAALIAALDILDAGMAPAVVVVTAEELSPALLCGMQSLGLLRHQPAAPGRIELGSRTLPAEGACAIVLESEPFARRRNAAIVARIEQTAMHGPGTQNNEYTDVARSMTRAVQDVLHDSPDPGGVVLGGSFLSQADQPAWEAVSIILDSGTPVLVPEYCTGNLLGAGLVRTLTAALWIAGTTTHAAQLDGDLPQAFDLASFFEHRAPSPAAVLTAAPAPGGGAAAVLLGREG